MHIDYFFYFGACLLHIIILCNVRLVTNVDIRNDDISKDSLFLIDATNVLASITTVYRVPSY